MKFVYPIKGQNYDDRSFSFQFGSFPISTFNTWHGGIHLENMNGALVAIAEGRIIAYKLPETYQEPCVDDTTIQYSDGFILVQHDYKSPEGQTLRYYSLYHHIMPINEINDSETLSFPPFMGKEEYLVNKKEGIQGLEAYTIKEGKKDQMKVVIPTGTTVQLDSPKEEKNTVKIGSAYYKKVTYTDWNNTTHKDIFINTKKGCAIPSGTNGYTIIYKKDRDNSVLGARIREKDSASSKIVKIIKDQDGIDIAEYKKEGWIPLKDGNGYIYYSSLKKESLFDTEKATKKDVTACDIPVKAGEHIGYVGKFGFKQQPSYACTHFEVFTDQDIEEFLTNKTEDGKEDGKRLYSLKAGATLEANLEVPLKVKAKTPIKVMATKDDYRKVKVVALQKELIRYASADNNLATAHVKYNGTTYNIMEGKLAQVNKIFGQTFTKNTAFRNPKGTTMYSQGKKSDVRLLRYVPENYNKEFWAHKNKLSKADKVGDEGQLSTAISQVYKDEPVITDGKSIKVEKEVDNVTINKKYTDADKVQWYHVQCKYIKDHKTNTKKGWIKTDDPNFTEINPFHWKDCGFTPLNAGSEYVFDIKGYNKKEDTCDFVTGVHVTPLIQIKMA